jgi:hypothetical protein
MFSAELPLRINSMPAYIILTIKDKSMQGFLPGISDGT